MSTNVYLGELFLPKNKKVAFVFLKNWNVVNEELGKVEKLGFYVRCEIYVILSNFKTS